MQRHVYLIYTITAPGPSEAKTTARVKTPRPAATVVTLLTTLGKVMEQPS